MRQAQPMNWMYFFIGCAIGTCIPFLLDQIFAYRDEFGVLNLQLGERLTLISVSPDDSTRALLVEPRSFIDRNFEVRIQEEGKSPITIYRSPDEDKPAGSERIIWSRDGSQFMLVGRHFISRRFDDFKLKNGEILYLMYNTKTKQMYCHWQNLPKFHCLPIPLHILQQIKESNTF